MLRFGGRTHESHSAVGRCCLFFYLYSFVLSSFVSVARQGISIYYTSDGWDSERSIPLSFLVRFLQDSIGLIWLYYCNRSPVCCVDHL